jgi:hypothetical protein
MGSDPNRVISHVRAPISPFFINRFSPFSQNRLHLLILVSLLNMIAVVTAKDVVPNCKVILAMRSQTIVFKVPCLLPNISAVNGNIAEVFSRCMQSSYYSQILKYNVDQWKGLAARGRQSRQKNV